MICVFEIYVFIPTYNNETRQQIHMQLPTYKILEFVVRSWMNYSESTISGRCVKKCVKTLIQYHLASVLPKQAENNTSQHSDS